MDVIINAECSVVPEGVEPLAAQGTALLNLLLCLGYDPMDPPLADLLRRFAQLKGDWLVLSPIHWQATHNDALILATGKDLELQDAQAKLWFAVFADYLAADGMKLHYHDAETWLLAAPQKHPLNAKPAHQLLNKSLMLELTQMGDTLFWQKFITESQMLFASKPNQSAMNGLWPWGNAVFSGKKAIKICADEAFLPIAKQCSSDVSLYSPSIKLKEQQILLITERSMLSAQHQEELEKLLVHWYWNNTAYASGTNNWFIRLWRTLIHAH